MNQIVIILLINLFNLSAKVYSQSVDQYYKSALLEKYEKTVRPDELTQVRLKLQFQQIISLDEKTQILTSSSHLFASWIDKRLQFNTSHNFAISIPLKQLWVPDLYVINTAESNGFLTFNDNNYGYVYPSFGLVAVNLGLVGLKTRCNINIHKFPLDQQSCSIIIGSWFQDHYRIRISLDIGNFSSELNDYAKNSMWQIEKTSSEMITTNSRFLKFTYNDDFYFNITLKRQSFYHMVTNVYPCFLLNFISIISYICPFKIQIYLSVVVFLNLGIMSIKLANELQLRSENLPLIVWFYVLNYFFAFSSIFWFCLVKTLKSKWIKNRLISNVLKSIQNKNFRLIKIKSKTEPNTYILDSKKIVEFQIDLANMNIYILVVFFLCILFCYLYILILILKQ